MLGQLLCKKMQKKRLTPFTKKLCGVSLSTPCDCNVVQSHILQYRTRRSDRWHIVALRDVVRHDSLQIPQGHSVYFDYDQYQHIPPSATLTRFLSYRLFLITSRRRTSLDGSISVKCQSLSKSLHGEAKSYQLSFLLSSRQVRYLTFGHTLHTFFAFQCFHTGFLLVTKNTHLIRNSIPLRHQQRLIPKRSLTSCLNSHTKGSASVF